MIKISEYNKMIKKAESCKVTAADFIAIPHHGKNTQFLIDHLHSDLKIQKKSLKKVNSFTNFFTSLFDSFVKNEFDAKLVKYESELEKIENNDLMLQDFFYYGGIRANHDVNFEKTKDDRRRHILLDIIAVLNDLIEGQSESGLERLKALEIALEIIKGEKSGEVLFSVDEFYSVISEIKNTVNDKITELQKKLIFLLRYKYRLIGRDIRQSFRNIIRIIFKNMDDQSGDDNNLFVFNFKKQHFSIALNYTNHVQFIRKRAIRIYT